MQHDSSHSQVATYMYDALIIKESLYLSFHAVDCVFFTDSQLRKLLTCFYLESSEIGFPSPLLKKNSRYANV